MPRIQEQHGNTQKSSWLSFINIPLALLMMQIDWSNASTVLAARYGFMVMQGALFFALNHVLSIIKDKEGNPEYTRPIWLPVRKATGLMDRFFGDGSQPAVESYKKTTRLEHELEITQAQIGQSVMGGLIPIAISMWMGIHYGIAMQVIMVPINAVQNPLIQMYLLGFERENPWGALTTDPEAEYEELEDDEDDGEEEAGSGTEEGPEEEEEVAQGAEALLRQDKPKPKKGKKRAPIDHAMEDLIISAWEDGEVVAPETIEQALQKGKDLNYAIHKGGWTLLMTSAASHGRGAAKAVAVLAGHGVDLLAQDDDGWTALHWAAFHSAQDGLRALIAAAEEKGVASQLVGMKTGDGRTVEQLVAAEQREVAEQLQQAETQQ